MDTPFDDDAAHVLKYNYALREYALVAYLVETIRQPGDGSAKTSTP